MHTRTRSCKCHFFSSHDDLTLSCFACYCYSYKNCFISRFASPQNSKKVNPELAELICTSPLFPFPMCKMRYKIAEDFTPHATCQIGGCLVTSILMRNLRKHISNCHLGQVVIFRIIHINNLMSLFL